MNVRYHIGAGRGAITHPQLTAVDAVVGGEEQRPTDGDQVRRGRAKTAGVDVLDEGRAGGRAIALPQLAAPEAAGREEQGAADVDEVGRARARGSGQNVLHRRRAFGGAVAAPELGAGVTAGRREERHSADRDGAARIGPNVRRWGRDVLEQLRRREPDAQTRAAEHHGDDREPAQREAPSERSERTSANGSVRLTAGVRTSRSRGQMR